MNDEIKRDEGRNDILKISHNPTKVEKKALNIQVLRTKKLFEKKNTHTHTGTDKDIIFVGSIVHNHEIRNIKKIRSKGRKSEEKGERKAEYYLSISSNVY